MGFEALCGHFIIIIECFRCNNNFEQLHSQLKKKQMQFYSLQIILYSAWIIPLNRFIFYKEDHEISN